MPSYNLPYGYQQLQLNLPDSFWVDWIEPAYVPPAPDPLEVVRQAIENPVDGISLEQYAGAKTVAIAVNDKTRPVPHEFLLPPLLDKLHAIGLPASAIKIMIATGTHIPMPPEEFPRILPDQIIQKYCVVSHNIDDKENFVHLGCTSRGSEVMINKTFYESDLKIVVGNIEPHHFAGFSGGYKTASIGMGERKMINHNHAMLVDHNSRIAEFENNPLRQDIEEIGNKIGVQFALNVILNGEKKIVSAVSGSPRAVMKAGIPISQSVCQIPSRGKYDMVIASVGGAPKDINFYQSQKALTHASLFTRDGGVIILVAECPEGSGSKAYEQYMEGLTTPQDVFEKFNRTGFQVGPHKAFQVARDAARVNIILLSKIPAQLVSRLLMTPASSLEEAVNIGMRMLGSGEQPPRVAVLPRATNTIPV